MSAIYRIHPAVGIARVGPGNQPYDCPTVAGGLPTIGGVPTTAFRDAEGKLNPQSAVFQVYAYDSAKPDAPGTPVQIGKGGVTDINWTVWLANKKSCWFKFAGPNGEDGYPANHGLRNSNFTGDRQTLILDPGPKSVSSASAGSASFDLARADLQNLQPFPVTSLGSIQASKAGELRVTGGPGNSGSADGAMTQPPGDFANNDGWFDEIADGPVSAKVTVNGTIVDVQVPAWVVCAPPKFAPQIPNLVTLRDTIYDIAVREQNYNPALFKGGKFQDSYKPNFNSEIQPILERPGLYQWAAKLPASGTSPHGRLPATPAGAAQFIFSVIRPPDQPNAQVAPDGFSTYMPYLAGDNPFYPAPAKPAVFLTVTQTQYFLLGQWAKGKLDTGPAKPLPPDIALDYGVLDNCVGGPFVPGIEITWISRNPVIYKSPFRINPKANLTQGKLRFPQPNTAYTMQKLFGDGVEPGDLSAFMAQPWQADYNECSSQGAPGDVMFEGTPNAVTLKFTLWWWAAQRPDWVNRVKADGTLEQITWISTSGPASNGIAYDDDLSMVTNWMDLGFLLKNDSSQYVLVQTNPGGGPPV